MTGAYDQKNVDDFESNTNLIIDAIELIKRDDSLKVSLNQIAKLTGLHRNTISDRGWPKGRLDEIKALRSKQKELQEKTTSAPSYVRVLEGKLENAFKELVYWYGNYQKIEDEHDQLLKNYSLMTDAKNMYQKKFLSEKQQSIELQKQIDRLTKLLNV